MIIGVDFDGTIVEHEFPKIGNPVAGAVGWLRTFQAAGAQLVLWTIRSDQHLADAVRFCQDNGIELFGVNVNPQQSTWSQSPKAYCHLYIDDAAFGCPLIENPGGRPFADWSVIGPSVMEIIAQFHAPVVFEKEAIAALSV